MEWRAYRCFHDNCVPHVQRIAQRGEVADQACDEVGVRSYEDWGHRGFGSQKIGVTEGDCCARARRMHRPKNKDTDKDAIG